MDCLTYLETLARGYDNNLKKFSTTTTFDEMKMDSYDVVDFLLKVEQEYGIVFEDAKMLELKSMQDVINTVNECSQEDK